MVAEVEPVSATKKKERNFAPLPIATKLKAKNMYLFQDATHEQIAKETGLTRDASENLAYREGWVKIRRERASILEKKADARAEQADLAIVEAIGSQAEEIALSGLERARDAVKRKGKDAAKNFQSWTGGIRNLVSAIKTIRARDGASVEQGPVNFNLFFVGQPMGQGQGEPKQVVDVTAKTVQ